MNIGVEGASAVVITDGGMMGRFVEDDDVVVDVIDAIDVKLDEAHVGLVCCDWLDIEFGRCMVSGCVGEPVLLVVLEVGETIVAVICGGVYSHLLYQVSFDMMYLVIDLSLVTG